MVNKIFNSTLRFLQKSYIRTIFIFFVIILIVNLILIGNGHFDAEPDDGSVKFERTVNNTLVDGFYFTTTQFSTIGYGDVTPKTNISKGISSLFHIVIIALTLKLFSEIGIMNKIDKDVENTTMIVENTPEGQKIRKTLAYDSAQKIAAEFH